LATWPDSADLCCLWGDWSDGSALLFSDPLLDVAGDYTVLAQQPSVDSEPADFVGGGWVGVIGYDGGMTRFRFYDNVLRLHRGQWIFEALWSERRHEALLAAERRWRQLLSQSASTPGYQVGEFHGPPRDDHLVHVERAVGLIRAGQLYQVNICTRLRADFTGSAVGLFADATERLQPSFAAYLSGESAVVSLSPELFLRRRGRSVVTAPIKGTRPRVGRDGNDVVLSNSVKDRAENVMIVDLMRNDLGRVSVIGSVAATSLLDVRAHPGVWHLESTVVATLRPDVTDADLIAATFAPGSVTGAPKIAAMSAIAAIEPARRGIYTGAIGLCSPTAGLELNVAIRTFEIAGESIELGVGGGVTADSVPVLEWRECRDKAAPLARAIHSNLEPERTVEVSEANRRGGCLETMLAQDGRVLRLADHLARLDRSLRELYGVGLPDDVGPRVEAAAGRGRRVVRVISDGVELRVTGAALGARPTSSTARTVLRTNGLWRHKWADRSELSAIEDELGSDVPLFIGVDGAVLETSRGNVFVIAGDGTLVTAPLRDDVLPGVTRRALLDVAADRRWSTRIRTSTIDDILPSRACFWTSSLSGLVAITSVDGVGLHADSDTIAEFEDLLEFWRRP
jgi:para-aminobenzoate synthetase/4-amino-4-deoxychorismate lyase